jgi:TDG/mug DNA glycosylase family protein
MPNLRLVVCGTAAGNRSAAVSLYYAGQGNKFWDILAEIGLTRERLKPKDCRRLLEYGIGLTDLVKGQSGNDSNIQFKPSGSGDLRKKLRQYQPRVLCFNGLRAAREFFSATRLITDRNQSVSRPRRCLSPHQRAVPQMLSGIFHSGAFLQTS